LYRSGIGRSSLRQLFLELLLHALESVSRREDKQGFTACKECMAIYEGLDRRSKESRE
jgi:hypothetical protein